MAKDVKIIQSHGARNLLEILNCPFGGSNLSSSHPPKPGFDRLENRFDRFRSVPDGRHHPGQ